MANKLPLTPNLSRPLSFKQTMDAKWATARRAHGQSPQSPLAAASVTYNTPQIGGQVGNAMPPPLPIAPWERTTIAPHQRPRISGLPPSTTLRNAGSAFGRAIPSVLGVPAMAAEASRTVENQFLPPAMNWVGSQFGMPTLGDSVAALRSGQPITAAASASALPQAGTQTAGPLPYSPNVQTLEDRKYQVNPQTGQPEATPPVDPRAARQTLEWRPEMATPGPQIIPATQSPAEQATNEVAGIAQRLRGLPTMQSERIAAESNARANLLAERDRINSGLMNRNAGARSGLTDPLAAALRSPVRSPGMAPPQDESAAPPRPDFATPRYGQTAQQAGSAYDAARTEGATRLQGAANRILAERGDTNGKSSIARVGQNSMMIKTPDGKVNVIGLRQRQLMSDAAQTGEFPQAQANLIRSQAKPTGSIVSAGRTQEQKDARTARAARLYGLPSSTPAVAQAAARAKSGGTSLAGLPAPATSFKDAAANLQKADQDPVFKQFGITASGATPSQVAKMLSNPDFQNMPEADHVRVRAAIQNMMVGGTKFNPKGDEKDLITAYSTGSVAALKKAQEKRRAESLRLQNQGIVDSFAPMY